MANFELTLFLVSQQVADGVPRDGDLDTAHGVGGNLVGIVDECDAVPAKNVIARRVHLHREEVALVV